VVSNFFDVVNLIIKIIFSFGLVEHLQTINNDCFCYWSHDFVTAVKLLGK